MVFNLPRYDDVDDDEKEDVDEGMKEDDSEEEKVVP